MRLIVRSRALGDDFVTFRGAWSVVILLAVAAPLAARAPSVPAADAPELAALGPASVGLIRTTVTTPGGRVLPLMIWYPARTGGTAVLYRRTLTPPDAAPLAVTTEGIAVEGAPPLPGRSPLVVVSHGFGGWAGGMTYLAENLASKNYVVASIEHGEGQGSAGEAGRRRVADSIVNRARDQQAVIAALAARAADPRDATGRMIDAGRVALIGYSMGGFGALATAGAAYDPASGLVAGIPSGALADQTRRTADPRLKAVVAIAPWGGQPPYRAWSEATLRGLTVPSLFIAGDRDDVSDYASGIRWLYDHATASDRWLLVYRHARHNVGGNPPPPETLARPDLAENFAEPVWRSDRITAINQHVVTAFLDRVVKGDAAHGAYLDVPVADADAATWTPPPPDRAFAGTAQTRYWRGFQRRWLLGLELRHDAPR